eukprot:Skav214195  [mRNA]  locus=scaffold2153:87469:95768:+ [translate_table: standard]
MAGAAAIAVADTVLFGKYRFLLLLAVAALQKTTSISFPLPFLLGLTLGLGNAVAFAVLPLLEEVEPAASSVLIPLVSFILIGCIAQLSWGVRLQADELAQTNLALRLLRDCTNQLDCQGSPLMAEGSAAAFFPITKHL